MDQNPDPQPRQDGRNSEAQLEKLALKALLLFFVAILVYIPAMSGGYLYDDDLLLTQNALVTRGNGFLDGESWKGLGVMWYPRGDGDVNDYAPMSSTTLWVEWRLWGEQGSAGYHITNILFHAIAALLLWMVLARIGMPGAWIAALIWAVHPVGVESVAWIAERRNTLSMPMLMLTLLAWLQFQETRRRRDYALALALFAGTLLSKSTVVMLPFFLLLWIWWKRGRVTVRDAMEAAPYFLFSLLCGLVTSYFQYERAIAGEPLPVGGLFHRIASACFALGFYFYKALLPFNLAFNYPEWHNTVPVALQVLPGIAFAAVFYWAWRNRATWGRHAILGLGFFVIMIAPALGILKMAYMRITLVADHFEYMPMAGLIALGVAGAVWCHERMGKSSSRYAIEAAAVGVVVLFSALTWQRADVFEDPEHLWVDTIAKNPDAWQAHEHLGGILVARNDMADALEHFRRGVEIRPFLGEVHNNYGNALRVLGHMQEGLEQNRIAVDLDKNAVAIRVSYADALLLSNRPQEAIEQYRAALEINRENPAACNNLGVLYLRMGKTEEAIGYFREALRMVPDFRDAQLGLDAAMRQQETESKK